MEAPNPHPLIHRCSSVFICGLSTVFGCGYSPVAPGTAGSLAAILIAIPFRSEAPWLFAVAALVLLPVAIWSADATARLLARKDPQIVVIDEVEGQWIALSGATHLNWIALGIGFAAFRLFDVWKPWPTRALEKLPGGWGIVLDDCMAGIYAALVLFACGQLHFY